MALAFIDADMCTACEACFDPCPVDAIALVESGEYAVVDKELCTGCEACVDECPVEAIEMKDD